MTYRIIEEVNGHGTKKFIVQYIAHDRDGDTYWEGTGTPAFETEELARNYIKSHTVVSRKVIEVP